MATVSTHCFRRSAWRDVALLHRCGRGRTVWPRFPIGTLSINVSACFMIGFILEYLNHHAGMNPVWRYGFAIGFIGAFSTFSTFEWETWSDFTNGAFWLVITYVAVSLIAGLIAVAVGSLTARPLA